MKPFPHDLNLGYGLCKCKHCRRPKAKRINHNTAMRMKANIEAIIEAEEATTNMTTTNTTEGE